MLAFLYYNQSNLVWLIRLHNITPKDYNNVTRAFKKIWFFPKQVTPMIFIKALIAYHFQQKSWRSIAKELHCTHIALFNFYSKYGKSSEIIKIIHNFADQWIIVFIDENQVYSSNTLDNSNTSKQLTINKINHILELQK